MSKVLKYIEDIKKAEAEGIDNEKKKRLLIDRLVARSVPNKLDTKLGKAVRDALIADAKRGQYRFRLKWILDLPVDIFMAIILAKKNTGKTTQWIKYANQVVSDGVSKIILVRMLAKEFDTAYVEQLNRNKNSDIFIRCSSKGVFNIYHKHLVDSKDKPIHVGMCCSVNSFTHYQGGEYEDYKCIIWDECISDDGNVKLDISDFETWTRFLSSVVRDKRDFKVFVFGNLLQKVTGVVGDPLLDFYGLDVNTECKYIPNIKGTNIKGGLFYYNFKGLLEGIESQGVLFGVDEDYNESLRQNTIAPIGIKTANAYCFITSKPKFALLFTYESIIYVVYISEETYKRQEIDKDEIWWILKMECFRPSSNYGFPIYTHEAALSNRHSNCAFYVEREDWDDMIASVVEMMQVGRVIYANDFTDREIIRIIKHWTLRLENSAYSSLM